MFRSPTHLPAGRPAHSSDDIIDEGGLRLRIGLAIRSELRRQALFQLGIDVAQRIVAAKRVAKRDMAVELAFVGIDVKVMGAVGRRRWQALDEVKLGLSGLSRQ